MGYPYRKDSGHARELSKGEIRMFVAAACQNEGYDPDSPERTVTTNFGCHNSLIEWFGTSNVLYDFDMALEYATQFTKIQRERDCNEQCTVFS